jgi:hypothetical protein
VRKNNTLLSNNELPYKLPCKTVIYFSDIPWRDLTQRQHHLCNNLANHFPVLYFSCNSITQLKKYASKNFREPFNRNPGLHTLELFLLPFTRFWLIKQLNFSIAFIYLFFYLKFTKIKAQFVLTHPSQVLFLNFPAAGFYYDYIDEAAEFSSVKRNAAILKKSEKKILDKCTGIFASSLTFEKQLKLAGYKNINLIPNGVNLDHFSQNKEYSRPADVLTLKDPLIGFYGAISDWIDLDLIKYLAIEKPEINIVLIGPVTINTDILKSCTNIHVLGAKLYSDLPAYLNFIDTWIIPFRQTEFTSKINPVKAYEYLAAGKTVISTYLPELQPLDDYLYLCRTNEEFLEKVKLAINGKARKAGTKTIKEILKNNSWPTTAEKLAKAVSGSRV